MKIFNQCSYLIKSYILMFGKAIFKKIKLFFKVVVLIMLVFQPNLTNAGINTGLSGDDVVRGPFPMGFSFKHYGKEITEFYVSTNGLLQFAGPTSAYSNYCLPAHNNTLYVFWDDLRTNVGGQPTGLIHYETLGDAPYRQLIVQWTNQYFYGSNLPMGTFQTILYEGSNQIKYQYRYLMDQRALGNSATIGIQGSNSQIVSIGCNKANAIAPEQAILFTPNQDMSEYHVDTSAFYDFIDISGLTPDSPLSAARYMNEAPKWTWNKVATLNTYEIDIQNQIGTTLYQQVLGDVNNFIYTDGFKHGASYRTKIRGSINKGGTWESWSGLSQIITIDTVKPTVVINGFSRTGSDSVKVTFVAQDDLSGVSSGNLQIASDSDFKNIVIEKVLSSHSNFINVEGLPTSTILYARITVNDYAGNASGYSESKRINVIPPTITEPVNNSVIKTTKLNVSGVAETAGTVQLYLNGKAVEPPVKVNSNGTFQSELILNAESAYKLTARACNIFCVS